MIYRQLIFFNVLAGVLFLVSCGSETSTPAPGATPATEVSAGPVLSVVATQKQSINLPNVYILVDDSFSMTESDNAGDACDLSGSRYKLAFFFTNVIEDWKNAGVVSPSQATSVWFLDGNNGNRGQFHNVAKDPQWEILDRLKNGDEISGTTHELSKIFYYDENTRSSVLESQIPNKSIIIVITDGDFRSTRENKNIDNNDWYDDKNNIATGVQRLKGREIETYFLLLCPRRLDDANLDEIKDTTMLQEWTTILPVYGAHVYGVDVENGTPKLDQRDFSSKLFEVLNQVLVDFYNVYGNGLEWHVIDQNGYDDYIDASTMFFYAGGTSYKNEPLQNYSAPLEIRLDGDLNFPDTLAPINGKDCGQHYFSVSGGGDVTLIWQQKQLLNFSTPANGKILFYNDQPSELKIQIPSGVDWSSWKNCLVSRVQLPDGTLLNSSFENDSSGGHILKIYSPQNGDTFQEYNLDLIFSWTNPENQIQKISLQYLRVYSPIYSTPNPPVPPVGNKIELNFMFVNKLGLTDLYQPTLYFPNTDCSLYRPNYYKPIGTPYPSISFTAKDNGYLVHFYAPDADYSKCQKMEVQWNDWPVQYLAFKPDTTVCDLTWDTSGHTLDSVYCN